jgi:uncharacterized membrane protein YqiK
VHFSSRTLVRVSGSHGVWKKPLLPGKCAFNTYAGKVITVPITNFALKWAKETIGTHRLDESLSEVALITKDAFAPALPLSAVAHIEYKIRATGLAQADATAKQAEASRGPER